MHKKLKDLLLEVTERFKKMLFPWIVSQASFQFTFQKVKCAIFVALKK
jgi:hypothetical protein